MIDTSMKPIEDSVAEAMSVKDKELLPHLPYILQDFWEMGTYPDVIIELIRRNKAEPEGASLLDLGCGKGAVCISAASKLGCRCMGVDAIPEFIGEAMSKAKELGVEGLCSFEEADIREKVKELRDYDVIVLGSIGQVFGDHKDTLSALKGCLAEDGLIIIDEGYHDISEPIGQQANEAGMRIIDEHVLTDKDALKKDYERELDMLTRRCLELVEMHPDKEELFKSYIISQMMEYQMMESIYVNSAIVFKPVPR